MSSNSQAVATQPPQQKKKNFEPAVLGDGTFVSRTPDGFLKAFYRDTVLREGTHYHKTGPKYSIAAEGYNYLNQIANINLIKPSTIVVDGREMPNPYIERDKKTGCVEIVWTRTIGIGYAPTGNLVIVDKTLVFNLKTYFIQDLQAKIKWNPVCGTWGVENEKPAEWAGKNGAQITASEKSRLCFIPIQAAGDAYVGMWIDYAHPEVMAAFNEFTSRLKFADRIADTICSRNVLKAHPAIGIFDVTDKHDHQRKTAVVRVYGFKHGMTADDLGRVAEAAEEGNLDKARGVAGGSVEVIRSEEPEEAQYEDVGRVAEEAEAEEQTGPDRKSTSGTAAATGKREEQPRQPEPEPEKKARGKQQTESG